MTAAPRRKSRRHGTFYVLEEPPPPTRRQWPPPEPDRQQIDVDYLAAWTDADADDAAYCDYERERDKWVRGNAPELAGLGPVHQCLLVQPGRPESGVAFEELDFEGRICGALAQGPRNHAFGSAVAVISAVTGRESDDPWVAAVCRALDRERTWDRGRRPRLVVEQGQGEMFHLTATQNRGSITQHGLDWRRMGAACGIAGSPEPELPAIFLCEDRGAISFFTMMARTTTDIWGVRVDGLWTENGPDGWIIIPEPVPRSRLHLVETDQPIPRHR